MRAPVNQIFIDVGGDAHTHSGFCQKSTLFDYCNSVFVASILSSQLLQKMQWYRTLLPDSLRELGDMITWPRFYVAASATENKVQNCCHCVQVHSLLGSIILGITLQTSQHHRTLVGPICDPPSLANSTFLARRLTMGREFRCQWTSCLEQLRILNFSHLTSRWTFSKPDWRHFCLTADLAHLVYLF